MLSASGPTGGHLVRLSDHKEPKKIAWFQCVGSRDMNKCDNSYCSSVCCMYAIKEAVIAKEHAGKDLDCAVFFMDIRTHGKDFERFYDSAKDKHGVRFIRSRVHSITPVGGGGDLEVRYITESGELATETFDMIVLSVGHGDLPRGGGNRPEDGHPTERGALLPDGLLQPRGDVQGRGLCLRCLPGPQGHPPVGRRLQRGRHRRRRDSQHRAQHPDQGQRTRARNQCGQRAAAHRGLRLPLRRQHRRCRGCACRSRVCENAAVRRIRLGQSVFLLPGHPGEHLSDHQAEKTEPGGGGGLHPENPRAALPGNPDQCRPEQVSVRNGQHPQP